MQKNTNGCGALIYTNYTVQNVCPIRDYIDHINNFACARAKQKLLEAVKTSLTKYTPFKKYTQDFRARLKVGLSKV